MWINDYAMNYLVKPFDNIKIRQAFALAINKDLIIRTVWRGLGRFRLIHIVPKGMPGYNTTLTGPDGVASTAGNQNKAKALFQAGLQEEGMTLATMPPIRLTYYTGSTDLENEVTALRQMWQNVLGVSVNTDPINFNKELSEIAAVTNNPRGLQFWTIGWIADYPDPQDWLTLQFDKGVYNNNMNYGQNQTSDAAQQQAIQQTLEGADSNPDQNARSAGLHAGGTATGQRCRLAAHGAGYKQAFLRKPCLCWVGENPQVLITPPNDWGSIYKSKATPCADGSSFQ